MSGPFASGKKALGACDRCGQQFKLKRLHGETVRGARVNNRVCPSCWDEDHPQNFVGTYSTVDPQALEQPRPDPAMLLSRDMQWGWAPVGGSRFSTDALAPNNLVTKCLMGTVTVATT